MINLGLYNKIVKESSGLSQNLPEWKMFLNICHTYLEEHNIKRPIVVELGALFNKQERFYVELLGAKHISIDITDQRCKPDIQGRTEDDETLDALKNMIAGKPINILFIDASHRYKSVKRDFERYHPLCSDIVVFHDIETKRESPTTRMEVWRFWDELKELSFDVNTEYAHYLFMSIRQCRIKRNRSPRMGIGLMIKK